MEIAMVLGQELVMELEEVDGRDRVLLCLQSKTIHRVIYNTLHLTHNIQTD